ncbi:AIPR family protein [Kitasatospora cinereorecta]
MLGTLAKEPENFWLFNNGVTVLCTAGGVWPGRRRPDEPVHLRLSGVSVVNGAQTVSAAHRAMQSSPEAVEDAEVTVKVIVVDEHMRTSRGGSRRRPTPRTTWSKGISSPWTKSRQ